MIESLFWLSIIEQRDPKRETGNYVSIQYFLFQLLNKENYWIMHKILLVIMLYGNITC